MASLAHLSVFSATSADRLAAHPEGTLHRTPPPTQSKELRLVKYLETKNKGVPLDIIQHTTQSHLYGQ